jgi:hypothetical protein
MIHQQNHILHNQKYLYHQQQIQHHQLHSHLQHHLPQSNQQLSNHMMSSHNLQHHQQHQQHNLSVLSPNSTTNSSHQSNSSTTGSNNEFDDQMPKYNFRALLRKTGQDLTNGSTLSKRRNQIETRQVDFRNVLRNRTKPSMEQVKLIQRLVTSH